MKDNEKQMSRRKFIKNTAAISSVPLIVGSNRATPLLDARVEKQDTPDDSGQTSVEKRPANMPMRRLGKTDIYVSVLCCGGFGGDNVEQYVERAIELGVNLFDTASQYDNEKDFGNFVSTYRDQIYVSSKFNGWPGPESDYPGTRYLDHAKREFENTMNNIKSDYLDIYLMHALKPEDNFSDYDDIWRWMSDLKDEGAVRFLGFSDMDSAAKGVEFIERYDPDVCMIAMNAIGKLDWVPNPTLHDFVEDVLPVAREHDVGVIAMKVMRSLVNTTNTPEECLAYVLNMDGVATAVVGQPSIDELEQNAEIVSRFVGETGIKHGELFDFEDIQRRARVLAEHLIWRQPGYEDTGGSHLIRLRDEYTV
ncbi:MAG: aldo/keto reductase [Gemmatimonadota bacterium]|nr:MAG: aldo/keto reductase [Gemmatimonadota bacterium]